MSELRNTIDRTRDAYREERYEGDLGEIAMATPASREPTRRPLAWALAIAAALLATLTLWQADPANGPTGEPVARTDDPGVDPLNAMPAIGSSKAQRAPSLVAATRLKKSRLVLGRAADRRRSGGQPATPPGLRIERWASPLAFSRPKPAPGVSLVSHPATTAVKTAVTTAVAPRTRRPRIELSRSSVALRSLGDAISLGT